jgi:hypothetical protein
LGRRRQLGGALQELLGLGQVPVATPLASVTPWQANGRMGCVPLAAPPARCGCLADIHDKTLEITGGPITVEASPATGPGVTLVGAGAVALAGLICIIDPG